jgi:hypothetical protein
MGLEKPVSVRARGFVAGGCSAPKVLTLPFRLDLGQARLTMIRTECRSARYF